jgi:hypothetical protein
MYVVSDLLCTIKIPISFTVYTVKTNCTVPNRTTIAGYVLAVYNIN